jgi:hypothetical protein
VVARPGRQASTKFSFIVSAVCVDCGTHLPLPRRLLRHVRCPDCEARHDAEVAVDLQRKEAAHDAGLQAYTATLGQLRLGVDMAAVSSRIAAAAAAVSLSQAEIHALNEKAFADYLGEALADDVITRDEDVMLGAVGQRLGVRMTVDQWGRYVVAAANAGLLPVVQPSQIMLNAGEASHLELSVRMLTKRVITERRTNYNSMSFPLGQTGVRYRVGQSRSRTVVVGTRTEVEDTGILAVTSKRIVFAGHAKTLEFRHGRMVGLRLFGDGIGLQIANRQSIPTFQTGARNVDALAGIINVAVGLDRGTFRPAAAPRVRPIALPPAPPLPSDVDEETTASAEPEPVQDAVLPPAEAPAPEPTEAATAAPGPAQVERDDARSRQIIAELAKIPGVQNEVAMVASMYQLGAGTTSDLEAQLDQAVEALQALDLKPPIGPLPPSITPHRPGDRVPVGRPPLTRETTASVESALTQLRTKGLTEQQAEGLRDDFRRGLIEEPQLLGVDMMLSSRSPTGVASPEPDAPAQPDADAGATDEAEDDVEVGYYLLNTNFGNDPADDAYMLSSHRAAAFFDPWKRKIEWLAENDYVFLYRNGAGIVAFGRATGQLETRDYHDDPDSPDEEYAMPLEPFHVLDQPMSAAEIKQTAERNVSFRQTMITLDSTTGEKLRAALAEQPEAAAGD